ncbi:hypothetical protein C8Q76DRAFT_572527, partial [Earliella scabrosa]
VLTDKCVLRAITVGSRKDEDEGYIRRNVSRKLRETKEVLRRRKAHTVLRAPPTDDPDPRVPCAEGLAEAGVSELQATPAGARETRLFALSGVKLSKLTQSLAYRAIRQRKAAKVKPRPRTETNLDEIRDGLEEACGRRPDDASIWRSLQSVHVLREAKSFMWMTMHDGYMVGTHWNRPGMGPELTERATCSHPQCRCTESMDHILFRCEAAGQAVVWNLLQGLWEGAGLPPVPLRWGTTLGAGCLAITTDDGKRRPWTEKLWAVLCSESLHLVWKLRCERVIQNEGAEHSEAEIENRWRAAVNARLTLDRRTAARAIGRKALNAERVAKIWGPVVEGLDRLPKEWVLDCGVLVGIKRGR